MSHPGQLVDHWFRHEAGKLVARLARRLGPRHWELAEEAVQEAMVRALKTWPFRGAPDQPAAWLARAAANIAIDRLRRDAAFDRLGPELVRALDCPPLEEGFDDQLAMMFACCHPLLPGDAQVALTLKTVCGFSVGEIARAFVTPEATIAQRIVRAKRRLLDERVAIVVPLDHELPARLDAALHVLYLLFNEGYCATHGDDLIRYELCEEAIRLGRLIAERPQTDLPKVHALLALQMLQASRFSARTDSVGDLLPLERQDRSKWDARLIFGGLRYLDRASAGNDLTCYHIEAGIAAVHAVAADASATDWPRLRRLYDMLLARQDTPVIRLNRAVVIARMGGPAAGLVELEPIAARLAHHHWFHATRGDFLARLGRWTDAAAAYRRALALASSAAERRYLERRAVECESAQDRPTPD